MSTVTISELMYVPEAGRDMSLSSTLNFDPAKFKTKEAAAKGLHAALIEYAVKVQGYSQELAEGEIKVWNPERTEKYSGFKQWCVVWESGPYDWAIGTSMQVTGPWGYCEPYYGFDLHFTD